MGRRGAPVLSVLRHRRPGGPGGGGDPPAADGEKGHQAVHRGRRRGVDQAVRTLRILATVAILAAARGRSFAAGSPKVGEPAPDFSARTLDGRTVTLSELRGR